jgi:glycerol-3-phosphate dehydrogenase (NAD(P)+)
MALFQTAMRVCVLGGGSWGTTVASLAAHNTETTLWCRDGETVEDVNTRHINRRYLEGFELHPELKATGDLEQAVRNADLLVMGIPSHSYRETLSVAAPVGRPWVPVLRRTKGLEQGTRLRMSQVTNEVLPGHPAGALTGPNLAKEILAGGAAASVVAMADEVVAEALQQVFSTPSFRIYVNDDVTGCELGGALKNVIALASGMADGLGTGDNTRAAVITRGLAEISRLGQALGGRAETFAGLTGMGDLIATCISPQSRNRFFGEQLGKGRTVAEVTAEMNQVAEGVKTAPVVCTLADEAGVIMPIAAEINLVVRGQQTAQEAYRGLVGRSVRRESDPPQSQGQ